LGVRDRRTRRIGRKLTFESRRIGTKSGRMRVAPAPEGWSAPPGRRPRALARIQFALRLELALLGALDAHVILVGKWLGGFELLGLLQVLGSCLLRCHGFSPPP
jgi:hypothetical protein